jgi:succinate dehydrogenase / fumarate reductase cytochrome b subunit
MAIGKRTAAVSISDLDGLTMRQRPLSPHLGIYKFAYTMATSIAHRASGIVLAFGFNLLVWWLMAAAAGPAAYARVEAVVSSGLGQLALAGWLLAFAYHFFNGLRHLNWDVGRGLERAEARRSALWVVVATVLLTLWVGYVAFFGGDQS